ncbi:MAG: CoA-binding protein [Alphaproteobacteria bacterium]|nr:CoA-binding protein [Alphaproteobacteria bacterium]MCB9695422.1 CoA-binding protein [Alphaproteobacteria bacterium]
MDIDEATKTFLALERIAVAGVSRKGASPANAIATRLREDGRQVFAINPSGEEIDGHPSWPHVGDVPGGVQGVVVVTDPEHATAVAREAGEAGAEWIWFHQGFGPVSYDDETLRVAHDAGLKVISVGCPMMYCCPDGFHRCARAVFRFVGRIPGNIQP